VYIVTLFQGRHFKIPCTQANLTGFLTATAPLCFLSTTHRRYLALLLCWGKQFPITLYYQEPAQTVIAHDLLSVIASYSATPSWAL